MEVQAELDAAIRHLAFAVSLCLKQAAAVCKFILAHTVGASSWQLALVSKLLHVDFCQIGMEIMVQKTVLPLKKRTSVVPNCSKLAKAPPRRQWNARACQHNGKLHKTVRSVSGCILRISMQRGLV